MTDANGGSCEASLSTPTGSIDVVSVGREPPGVIGSGLAQVEAPVGVTLDHDTPLIVKGEVSRSEMVIVRFTVLMPRQPHNPAEPVSHKRIHQPATP